VCNEEGCGLGKHLTLPATDQAGEGDQQEVHKSLSPTLPATDQAGEGDQRGVHKLLSFFSVSPSAGYRVTGAVNQTPVTFIVDTGAAVTLISRELWEKATLPGIEPEPLTDTELVGANGTPIDANGSAVVTLTIAEVPFSVRVVIVERLTTEAILGMDFLTANNCTIQVGKKLLEFPNLNVSVPLISRRSVTQQVTVKNQEYFLLRWCGSLQLARWRWWRPQMQTPNRTGSWRGSRGRSFQ
jgi:hypothetical protein